MTTHKPKPPEWVLDQAMRVPGFGHETLGFGISDITAQVDAKLTPVNIANEAFGACQIRCQIKHGEWLAECDRLAELARQLKEATDEAVREACK